MDKGRLLNTEKRLISCIDLCLSILLNVFVIISKDFCVCFIFIFYFLGFFNVQFQNSLSSSRSENWWAFPRCLSEMITNSRFQFELHLGQGILEGKKTCKLTIIFMVFWILVFFLNLLTTIFQSSKIAPPSIIISNYCHHNSGRDKESVVTPHNRTGTSTIEFCNIVCSFFTFLF